MKAGGLAVLLGAIVVFGGLFYFVVISDKGDSACPGHFHATFAIYVPDANGAPSKVDFSTPRASNGVHYYDLSGGAGMSLSLHMHQSGSEKGSDALGPTQWHLEKEGQCVSLKTALRDVEATTDSSSIKLTGGHAQANQAGSWSNNGDQRLRFFMEAPDASGRYSWSEVSASKALGHNIKDGESFLVAFGSYSDAQLEAMQGQIPAPISRPAAPAPGPTVTGATTTGVASPSTVPTPTSTPSSAPTNSTHA